MECDVGDKIKIINKKCMKKTSNIYNTEMSKYCGKTVTISKIKTYHNDSHFKYYNICEDGGKWNWDESCFEYVIKYKGYFATFYYNANDKIYVGELLHTKDSINFYGRTKLELIIRFHHSVRWYIKEISECFSFAEEMDDAVQKDREDNT